MILLTKFDNDCIEKGGENKRMVVRDFEDDTKSKMIYALNNVDEVILSAMTINLDYRLERTDSLRSVILHLISFEQFVDNIKEHENDVDKKHVIEH